ncbi:MAG: PEP-CTERM sorting domain-containing protein [Spirulina sp. DLM2.Bin59]|nr:MAG: PEP-CTERM sorting domain-containing protein [Spirulina sp. DLM2.Bin59]
MKRLISTLVASSLLGAAAVGFSGTEALAQRGAPAWGSTDCTAGSVGLLDYAACVTAAGNDAFGPTGGPLLDGLRSGTLFSGIDTSVFEWSFMKSDDAGSPLVAGSDATGSWSLAGMNLTGPFVVSLKAGNEFSAYYFNNVTEAISSGTFSTANNRGLSHMTIATAVDPNAPQDTPEPFSMIGAGLAISAGAWMKKRNKKA